jgi:glutamate dehydrogenase (NADP+)
VPLRDIHERCIRTAEENGAPGDYIVGANLAGFLAVADAMLALGVT